MSEMTVACLERQTTRLTGSALVRDTHAPIERTMGYHRSIVFEVEKFPVRDFDDALTNDIIIGPG